MEGEAQFTLRVVRLSINLTARLISAAEVRLEAVELFSLVQLFNSQVFLFLLISSAQ